MKGGAGERAKKKKKKRTVPILWDLENYGKEFELHSVGDWQSLEVFEQSDDKIRGVWLYCSLLVIVKAVAVISDLRTI